MCWHWDHSINKALKGVNQLSLIYYSKDITIPVGLEFIKKTEMRFDKKSNKNKRYSKKDKNEYFREMLLVARNNQIKYKYTMTDSWYFNAENINFIKLELKKDVIMAYKGTTHLFLSKEDRVKGINLDVESLKDKECVLVYIKGVEFPLKFSKHILKDQDNKVIALYLVTTDLTLDSEKILQLYKKRWLLSISTGSMTT